jgi:two-component system, LytTR family, sensor kinase
MPNRILQKRIWGIPFADMLILVGFFVINAILYRNTIIFATGSTSEKEPLNRFVLEYSTKLIFFIPFWWFFIRKLAPWPFWAKALLHIPFMALYAKGWQQLSYTIGGYLNIGHMWGRGEIWDVYIAGLQYILLFSAIHAYSYHLKMKAQLLKEAELKQLNLQSELTALKAQINPHFLYNVFNTINASLPPEQENTREMIATLADLFRYQLKATKIDLVTVAEELEFTRKYLSLEKARFQERLQLEYKVDPAILSKKIPPLILQPLVENAVKHGISPKIEGGEVSIQIKDLDGKLHFEISDTGVGNVEKAGLLDKGIGLGNTAQRLEKMYGILLKLEDNKPSGFKISFDIGSVKK